MAIELDHLMWGAPTLEAGMAEAERLFGVVPAPGGVHPGVGTQNALLSLGERHYLEIIAPDPNQDLAGTFGERIAGLESCGLITWAAAVSGLAAVAERAAGMEPHEVRWPADGVPRMGISCNGNCCSWAVIVSPDWCRFLSTGWKRLTRPRRIR